MNERHNNRARLVRRDIRRRFDRAAEHFDTADFVHRNTCESLRERIEPLLVDADVVIDLGSATSSAQRDLSRRFKGARVVGVDISQQMLKRGRGKKTWLSKSAYVQASATAIPFADQSVDVVFANLLLPWIDDLDTVFSEISRVLTKGGVFAFATLGPDSFLELERAWRCVDDAAHVNRFPDMHDLGDGLVRAGLSDPVLDVDRLTIQYVDSDKLFADLTAAGARNALDARSSTLTGRRRFQAMCDALAANSGGGKIVVTLELVFGHCWGAGPKTDAHHFRIDAASIPRRRPG